MSKTPNDIRKLLGLSARVAVPANSDSPKPKETETMADKPNPDIRKLLGLRSSTAKPGAKPAAPQMDTLRGTGITKRMLQSQEKAIERQQEKTSELDTRPVLTGTLESTRMDLSAARLDASQIAAVQRALVNQYACIIGSAGRGKTTVANTIINGWALAYNGVYDEDLLFSNLSPDPKDSRFRLPETVEIAVVSYTGRAVQNIQRALPAYLHGKCKTIHSLLEYAPTEEEYLVEDEKAGTSYTDIRRVFRPRRTADNPLTLDILIIDEGGMTPIKPLWEELMAALPTTCRILKLGDIQQLPPVHGRSTLGFAMLSWPSFELQKTWRQSSGTRIIDGADEILAGRVPRRDPEGGVHMVELPAGSMQSARVVKGIVRRLFQEGRWDPLNDAIIVPMNKYDLGQEQLNRDLVTTFNPPRYVDGDKKKGLLNPRITIRAGFENRVFAVGDKVMATQNDWDEGIANGMVGVIVSITANPSYRGSLEGVGENTMDYDDSDFDLDGLDSLSLEDFEASHPEEGATAKRQASHIVEVQFQNMETSTRFSTTGAVNSLNLGYVMTCHKAQGGEYKRVLVVCHSAAKQMLSREWLYTAWTRAKTEIFVLANSRGLQMAVRNQTIKGKTLQEKARAFIALMDKGDDSVPTLPEPVEIGLPR